ncbi:DUF2536 family protein [Acinetobacter soli]|uniref:DUF2536 family protein n=1 Tax=Acinetobacter soli TaxID=487316 RepID=UPI00124F9D6E|nr:DUF2536 family protein [Acinetobacter soli]MDQ9833507.1 DUF2536 domain-containing protein [Acinetobacter soli]
MQQVKIFETKVFSKLETDINHWIEYEYSKNRRVEIKSISHAYVASQDDFYRYTAIVAYDLKHEGE